MKLTHAAFGFLMSLGAMAMPAAADEWVGWVTDEHCGGKGNSAEHKSCAEKCVKDGAKLVFYNNADKKIYKLDNQDLAKSNLGHESKVKGTLEGDAIKVESIEAVK